LKKGKITINLNLQKEAEAYASISKAYTSDRHDFHEGGLDAKRRKMFEGKLGEKVVKQFFDNNDIFYVEDNSSHKEADNFDFIIFLKKNNQQIKVDVKTRTENFHTRTLEMLEQFDHELKDINRLTSHLKKNEK
jgi:hypothetical protein